MVGPVNLYEDNIILQTDSYKPTHWGQYPPNTQRVASYQTARGGPFDEVCFVGLQPILMQHLQGQVVTKDKLWEAQAILNDHFGRPLADVEMWEHIIRNHDGHLPLKIKALPEGTVVSPQTALYTIENTDRTNRCRSLTNYVESLLMHSWYPTTVATLSRTIKKDILRYLDLTGSPADIDFKLHDFGYRGATCPEQAAIGGMAHLVNFKGSDTLVAIKFIRKAYGSSDMPCFSIVASEHSTITSWGKDGELGAYRNMLEKYPEGYFACVSDSWDIFHAADVLWGQKLHAEVMGRKGTLVIRPDSGEPVSVILRLLDILGDRFGFSVNRKGYKVLVSQVRLIQGDGVTREKIADILAAMEAHGWSADNIAFGMGGALIQGVTRDTMKFATKCSAVERDYVWQDVYKDPVTDPGKKSYRGRMSVVRRRGETINVPEGSGVMLGEVDLLRTVFENGEIRQFATFDEVRSRAAVSTAAMATAA